MFSVYFNIIRLENNKKKKARLCDRVRSRNVIEHMFRDARGPVESVQTIIMDNYERRRKEKKEERVWFTLFWNVILVQHVVVVDLLTMRTSSCINYYVLCLVCWILLGISGKPKQKSELWLINIFTCYIKIGEIHNHVCDYSFCYISVMFIKMCIVEMVFFGEQWAKGGY